MTTGLDVLDKSARTTNIWLDEIMAEIGPDRRMAWHVRGVVLRCLRDRISVGLGIHLGAQLPLVIRGAYYDQYTQLAEPLKIRSQDEFLAHVQERLGDIRPVNPRTAVIAVFNVLSRHIPRGQSIKVRDALPDDLKVLWKLDEALAESVHEQAELGRTAQNARDARNYESKPDGQRRG
jgi:uncharacterized protein (DUF2267 family)